MAKSALNPSQFLNKAVYTSFNDLFSVYLVYI